ncbi:unnamed protein product [Arabidopsis thaliana]|uniref:Uncharacterized protein n=1 Tax=Arabidopsis thaliana TaxID=3702 RepID=A0A5S9WRU7_ARATH|nr:unnamed protein product [Arabidopsis thaliana]
MNLDQSKWLKTTSEISHSIQQQIFHNVFDIIECGVKNLREESIRRSYESVLEDDTVEYCDRTGCWSWLFLCFDLSKFVENVRSLVSGRRR